MKKPLEQKIMDVMGDGRERTLNDLMHRLGVDKSMLTRCMIQLANDGTIISGRHSQTTLAIYRKA